MKNLLPFIPLYLFILITLILLLKSFINAFFPPKVKSDNLLNNRIDKLNQENELLYSFFTNI